MGHNDDAAIFFHPLTDSANGLEKIFGFCNIVKPDFFPWSINSHLSKQLKLSNLPTLLCISQRYHGCIWALLEGIRCLGISNDSDSKIFQLYHALACDEFCVDLRRFQGRQQLIDYSNSLDWPKLFKNLSVIREKSLQVYCQAYQQVFINKN